MWKVSMNMSKSIFQWLWWCIFDPQNLPGNTAGLELRTGFIRRTRIVLRKEHLAGWRFSLCKICTWTKKKCRCFFWNKQVKSSCDLKPSILQRLTVCLFLFPCGAWISAGFCLHADFSPTLSKTMENEHETWTSPVWKRNHHLPKPSFVCGSNRYIIFSTGIYTIYS